MRYADDPGPPMFTYALTAAFVAFFAAEYKQFDLTKFYAFPWRVADGEVWRLVSCSLLHGSVFHIAFNVALFVRFSTVVDDWLGPWGALLAYVTFASSANAMQLLIGHGQGVIGASGAVYGLFGLLWVIRRRRDDAAVAANRHIIETMLFWLGICAVLNVFGGNIGNTTHVWGLLLGWTAGQAFVARKRWRPLVIAGLVAAWALPIALSQRPVWDRTLAHLPSLGQRYVGATNWPGFQKAMEDPANQHRPGLFR